MYNKDKFTIYAILMNFIIIGEMANKIGDEIKKISPNIKWNMIKGLRNIIAHDYFGVDADVVWEIIKNDLPQLKMELKKLKK